ncbi:glycosyltransferase family 2 protein [Bradyrhizobium sp. STM 3562]|uniref:glycosyltransferase family 2 protein n=1 Tax=Bradyrhizobium sp. STM 3562 TaxID=578924 RepID=UPI00388EA6EC
MDAPETSEVTGPETEIRQGCSESASRDAAKLAVIITCYNYEAFVERAINSVLDQKRDDCELVVVDDGSTDGSWQAIGRCGARAFRIDNRGQLGACVYGLERTQAPFVLFLDADDELKPGSLAALIDELDERVAKIQFALTLIDADDRPMGAFSSLDAFRDREGLLDEVLRRGVYKTPPTSGNVFRRDVCELLREVDYDKAVDGIILFAAPLFGDVVSLSEELGYYRVHGRNDSRFGQIPTAGIIERDIDRFVVRTEHLRRVVQRLAPGRQLVQCRDAFYYRERKFCLDIVSGHRPRLTALPMLLAGLAAEPYSLKVKLAMMAFFVLGSVLPSEAAKTLLAYRSKSGERSALGFAREFFRFRAPARR